MTTLILYGIAFVLLFLSFIESKDKTRKAITIGFKFTLIRLLVDIPGLIIQYLMDDRDLIKIYGNANDL